MFIPDWSEFPELTLEDARAYEDFVADLLAWAEEVDVVND